MSDTRHVLLDGDKVANVILLNDDDLYVPAEGLVLLESPEEVGIGWSYVDGAWIEPEHVEPAPLQEAQSVTDARYEALAQLTNLGITDDVARTIVGLPPA